MAEQTLADRAAAMAVKARTRAFDKAAQSLAVDRPVYREWHRITRTETGEQFDLFSCPPESENEVRTRYRDCIVVPLLR